MEIWTYRIELAPPPPLAAVDLVGFDVETADGEVGKIDEATYETGDSYVVVDTGPWIFGKKVTLPAGLIDHVDWDGKVVSVASTKEQIKEAPSYHGRFREREALGDYYTALHRVALEGDRLRKAG